MKSCLLGIVSWCDSDRFPQRYKVFKRAVNSIKKFAPRDICTTAVIDNNSSDDVKSFIESSDAFDVKVLLPENIHDVGAYALLSQIAKDNNLSYLWLLENDYVLFDNALEDAIRFLKGNKKCGYVRMQKFTYANKDRYDKLKKETPHFDKENSVWMKNLITDDPIQWSTPYKKGKRTFYVNNWHFGLHGGLISLKTWEKIFPPVENKVPYYYKLESYMRTKYHNLGLKTGVLDNGCFSMEAPSVYQAQDNQSVFKYLKSFIPKEKGGYLDSKSIQYYISDRNYKKFSPMQIQLFSNSLGFEELNELKKVFDSKWLGYGARSKKFEQSFASLLKAKYALGISSCTAGLFMSMEILDIKKGDEVIIPSICFIGCANAVIKSGATPVYADVDSKTFNLVPKELKRLITKRTKAIILLHYGGFPCDYTQIKRILTKYKQKIYIIEDSANSIKTRYKNKYCGTLGDIGLFSLDANKVITTGTGGVLVTNDSLIYRKALAMRFYGLTPSSASGYDALKAKKERWWEIELEHHGNRYLINDITSAIALAQMEKLDVHIQARKRLWHRYQKSLRNLKHIELPPDPRQNTKPGYYFYWVRVKNNTQQLSLANYLVGNGIYTSFRYYPLHLIQYYKSHQKLPNAEKIAQTTLNIPLHHNISEQNFKRIVQTIVNWDKKVN